MVQFPKTNDSKGLYSDFLGGGNSNILYFTRTLGKIPILTNLFQGWFNHQLVIFFWKDSHLAHARRAKWNRPNHQDDILVLAGPWLTHLNIF